MRRLAAFTLLLALVAPARVAARGEQQFARIERVDVVPYFAGLARVRVFLTLVHLNGSLIDKVKPDELVLTASGQKLPEVPWIAPYDTVDDELHVVFVVEVGTPYAGALDTLKDLGARISKDLPRSARVAVIPYGTKVTRAGKLGDAASAQRAWKKLRADEEEGELQLAQALDKAVKLVAGQAPAEPRNSVRRLVVVVSDGIEGTAEAERQDDTRDALRKKLKKVAKQARDAGVTVHSVGFSYLDDRLPLRNLGELSKQTGGTFRWAKTQEGLGPHLDNVKLEILKQPVLTYFVPASDIEGKVLAVECKSALCGTEPLVTKDKKKAPEAQCGGAPCLGKVCLASECVAAAAPGRGLWFWLAVGGGALVLVGGATLLLRRRSAPRPAWPGTPVPAPGAAPGAAPAPAAVPAPAAARAPAAPAAPRLMFLTGHLLGRELPLSHGFTIGRGPGNHLSLDDPYASARHAQFLYDQAGNVTIVDLGSHGGILVNGVRQARALLVHGTTIRIGATDLRFLR